MIILLIAFGTILAMALPIVTALAGVICGIAIIGLLTRVLAVPDFTPIIATLIGIGVGIDYALLMVSRHRSAVHDGMEPIEAAALATDTSGRAVLFAGLTVVISLAGLFMMNLDFMRSVALGAMLAVLFTMAAAITLLPALLGFVGENIDRPNLRDMTSFPTRIYRRDVGLLQQLLVLIPAVIVVFLLAPTVSIASGELVIGLSVSAIASLLAAAYIQFLRRDEAIRRQVVALVVTVAFFPVFIISYVMLGVRRLIGGKPGQPGMQYEGRSEMERSFWYRWSRVIQRYPWPAWC